MKLVTEKGVGLIMTGGNALTLDVPNGLYAITTGADSLWSSLFGTASAATSAS